MNHKILSTLALSAPLTLLAQDGIGQADVLIQPEYLIAILTGVVLAIGLQILFTAMSIAVGVSSIQDVRQRYIDSHYNLKGRDQWNESTTTDDSPIPTASHPALQLTKAFGIWSTVTIGLSLFIATYLALNLLPIASQAIAVTIALVIWAATLMILFYVESRLAKTLLGGLISVATSGLKASADMMGSVFKTSEGKKNKELIDHTISRIRAEFDTSLDTERIEELLSKHTEALDRLNPDMNSVKEEIQQILQRSDEAVERSKQSMQRTEELVERLEAIDTAEERNEQESKSAISSALSTAKWVAIQAIIKRAISRFSAGDSLSDKLGAKQLSQLLDDLEEAYNTGESRSEGVRNVLHELSPLEEERTDKVYDSILDFFSTRSLSSMEGEDLEKQMKAAAERGSFSASRLSEKLNGLSAERLIEVLTNNTSLAEEDVEKAAFKARILLDDVKANYADITVNGPRRFKRRADEVLHDFFQKVDRPELDYEELKKDITAIMDDPQQSLDTVKARAQRMDSDTLWALLNATVGIGKSDRDRLFQTISDTRDAVIQKVDRIQAKVERSIENTKRKAVIKAENTRRLAATAAWWLVASSIISALAAVGGGLLSI